jgi:hypothetical protein
MPRLLEMGGSGNLTTIFISEFVTGTQTTRKAVLGVRFAYFQVEEMAKLLLLSVKLEQTDITLLLQ